MRARQLASGGHLQSALAKTRGLVLRLSLGLQFLWWCGDPGKSPPPRQIGRSAFFAACTLIADYSVPMAERVYGDAETRTEDRDAATLARWIIDEKTAEVHARHIQREVRLPGLTTAAAIHAAAQVLIEAGWLLPPGEGGFQRRGRCAYPVNLKVFEANP
jgi:hypothetical protein